MKINWILSLLAVNLFLFQYEFLRAIGDENYKFSGLVFVLLVVVLVFAIAILVLKANKRKNYILLFLCLVFLIVGRYFEFHERVDFWVFNKRNLNEQFAICSKELDDFKKKYPEFLVNENYSIHCKERFEWVRLNRGKALLVKRIQDRGGDPDLFSLKFYVRCEQESDLTTFTKRHTNNVVIKMNEQWFLIKPNRKYNCLY